MRACPDPAEVLGILVHELVHAALPPDAKHGKAFRDAALRIGLEGPMRHALPGAVLKERLTQLPKLLAGGSNPLGDAIAKSITFRQIMLFWNGKRQKY